MSCAFVILRPRVRDAAAFNYARFGRIAGRGRPIDRPQPGLVKNVEEAERGCRGYRRGPLAPAGDDGWLANGAHLYEHLARSRRSWPTAKARGGVPAVIHKGQEY